MPVPTEIDLLSTRVDSYRHPIDSPSPPYRPPKILVLTPAANRQNRERSTPIDGGRQLSTWVDRFHRVENRDFEGFWPPMLHHHFALILPTVWEDLEAILGPPFGLAWIEPPLAKRPVSSHD